MAGPSFNKGLLAGTGTASGHTQVRKELMRLFNTSGRHDHPQATDAWIDNLVKKVKAPKIDEECVAAGLAVEGSRKVKTQQIYEKLRKGELLVRSA